MLKAVSSMATPTFEYDVYNTPRIGPIEFGEFVAAEAPGRESVIRAAKYARRGPRTRAWFARQHIAAFLSSPLRKIGDLDAALGQARSDMKNESLPDQKQADAGASAECLHIFIKNLNILNIYSVHAITRNSRGEMMRKLSETESAYWCQFAGTFWRRKPGAASANWAHVAWHLLWVTCLCMRPQSRSMGFRCGQ